MRAIGFINGTASKSSDMIVADEQGVVFVLKTIAKDGFDASQFLHDAPAGEYF